MPGEWYSPTQPIPTKPPAYSKNGTSIDDLIDFTPELRAQAESIAARFKLGPIFTPPVVSKAGGPLATLARGPTNGGSNWPGGAFDPETHTFYVASSNAAPVVLGLVQPSKERSDMDWIAGFAPQPGGARMSMGGLNVQGLPLFKPPYGTMTAINLDKGEIAWQVPHGDTPDGVRNHEALKGTEPSAHRTAGLHRRHARYENARHRRRPSGDDAADASARRRCCAPTTRRRAREVGAVLLPAPVSASPMTYAVNGRQYIVVAVSGGPYSGEFIALRLGEKVDR